MGDVSSAIEEINNINQMIEVLEVKYQNVLRIFKTSGDVSKDNLKSFETYAIRDIETLELQRDSILKLMHKLQGGA